MIDKSGARALRSGNKKRNNKKESQRERAHPPIIIKDEAPLPSLISRFFGRRLLSSRGEIKDSRAEQPLQPDVN